MKNDLILRLAQQAAPVIAAHPVFGSALKKISAHIFPQSNKSSTSAITASILSTTASQPKYFISARPPANPATPTLIANKNEVRALMKFHNTPVRHFSHSKAAFSDKKEDKTGVFFETRFGSNSGSGIVYKPFENIEIKDGKFNYKFYEDDDWAIGTNGVDYKVNSCKIL
jgi:hypothetical protein